MPRYDVYIAYRRDMSLKTDHIIIQLKYPIERSDINTPFQESASRSRTTTAAAVQQSEL